MSSIAFYEQTLPAEAEVIEIPSLRISNPEVISFLSSSSAVGLEQRVDELLSLGVRAAKVVQPTIDLACVRQEFENLRGQLEQAHGAYLGPQGRLQNLLNANQLQIDELFERYLDPKGACYVGGSVGQAVTIMLEDLARRMNDQMRQMFDTTYSGSPANTVVRQVDTQLAGFRGELAALRDLLSERAGRKEESKRGTAKGREYEAAACDVLMAVAAEHGDTFSATGCSVGVLPRSKKGDAVVAINHRYCNGANVKVVFEMKENAIKADDLQKELAEAMENRGATLAVAVLAGTDLEAAAGRRVGQWDEKTFFCVLDRELFDPLALQVAYDFVRASALRSSRAANEQGYAVEEISEKLEECINAFDQVAALESYLSEIKKQSGKAQQSVYDLKDTVLGKLVRIQSLLTGMS